jgi:ABC-type uncharacterized transport system auxiliary subunit
MQITMNMKKILLIIAIPIIVLSGCRSSKPVETSFYVIEMPADKQVLRPDSIMDVVLPIKTTIELDDINVNPAFSATQIAIRENTNKIRYFSHHQWAIRPDQSFTRFALRYFEKNKVVTNFGTRFWKIPVGYILKTNIHRLEVVVTNKDKFNAHLFVEFSLMNTKNEEVVLHYSSDKMVELPKRDLNMFADTISELFFNELQNFTQQAVVVLSNTK